MDKTYRRAEMELGVQSQKTGVEMEFHEAAASGFQLCLYRERAANGESTGE